MDLAAMKALSRRVLGLWAGDCTDDPHAFLSSDYVNRQEPYAEDGSNNLDLDRWLELVAHHRTAFPDCKVDILLQIAEDNKVATRWRFHGTNSGVYRGKAPTGRLISWTGVAIDVMRDDKVAESYVDWDMHRQLVMLGHLG